MNCKITKNPCTKVSMNDKKRIPAKVRTVKSTLPLVFPCNNRYRSTAASKFFESFRDSKPRCQCGEPARRPALGYDRYAVDNVGHMDDKAALAR